MKSPASSSAATASAQFDGSCIQGTSSKKECDNTRSLAEDLCQIMKEALEEFGLDVCAVVVPKMDGYFVHWHGTSELPKPSKETLQDSRLFGSPLSKTSLAISDLTTSPIFKFDPLVGKGCGKIRFYMEHAVHGTSGRTILGTLVLAHHKSAEPLEGAMPLMQSYASRVSEALHRHARETNDLMMPHIAMSDATVIGPMPVPEFLL